MSIHDDTLVLQVCATLSAVDANSPPSQEALHHDVLAQMTDCITGLCIPTSAKRVSFQLYFQLLKMMCALILYTIESLTWQV